MGRTADVPVDPVALINRPWPLVGQIHRHVPNGPDASLADAVAYDGCLAAVYTTVLGLLDGDEPDCPPEVAAAALVNPDCPRVLLDRYATVPAYASAVAANPTVDHLSDTGRAAWATVAARHVATNPPDGPPRGEHPGVWPPMHTDRWTQVKTVSLALRCADAAGLAAVAAWADGDLHRESSFETVGDVLTTSVAWHPAVTVDLLDQLVSDDPGRIGKVTEPVGSWLPHAPQDAPAGLLRWAADHDHNLTGWVCDQLVDHADVDVLRWAATCDQWRLRNAAVANPACPTELVAEAASARAKTSRAAAAANPNCPPDLLDELATDDDPDVVAAVGNNPAASDAARVFAHARNGG